MQDDFNKQNSFQPIEQDSQSSVGRRAAAAVISVLIVITLAVIAALLIKHFVVTEFIVDGISMYPTLDGGSGPNSDSDRTNGEILYLNKVSSIKRGDIVVFPEIDGPVDENGNPRMLVKRVIGIAGDHIQIIDNQVYRNGVLLDEQYINEPMTTNDYIDITVDDGYIFCMGDNRNHSHDCRHFGQVPLKSVIGQCFMIKSTNNKLRVCH